MSNEKIILFIEKSGTTFIKRDLDILKEYFSVKEFHCQRGNIFKIIISQLNFFLWLLKNVTSCDVLFINFADYHSFLPVIFAKIFKKKSLIIIGGYEAVSLPEINYGALRNNIRGFFSVYSIRNADFILPVSNYLKQEIENRISKVKGKIIVVYRGFSPDEWPFSYKKDQNLILTVGNVFNWKRYKVKGLDFFIQVAEKIPELRFVIIGIHPHLFKILKGKLPNNVVLEGKKTSKELVDYYQKAKVYCHFSRSEGFCNAIAESMLCGCIPVVSDVGGIPEATGNNGYSINLDITKAIESIRRAVNDGPKKMRECRQYIVNNYPLVKRKSKLYSLINNSIYNEFEYWNSRYRPNAKIIPTLKHLNFVKDNIKDCKRILDYGPGIGRMIPAYNKASEIYAYDISTKYRSRLLKEAKKNKIKVNLIFSDKIIPNLKFSNNYFDAVICISILLHQKPENIVRIMEELRRVSKKVIVISYFDNEFKPTANHVFNYDYKKICKENSFELIYWDYQKTDSQVYFIYK